MLVETQTTLLEISWEEPEIGGGAKTVAEFVIRWAPETDDGNEGVKTVSSEVTSSTITSLTSNTRYTISVAACDITGQCDGETKSILGATCEYAIKYYLLFFEITILKNDCRQNQ